MNRPSFESKRGAGELARPGRARGRRGFTLVEILFSIGIVFLLMALLFVGFRAAHGFANKVANTQTVTSLKTGISHFQSEFGFLPPLVKDDLRGDGPLTPVNTQTKRRSVEVYSVSDGDDLLALQGRPTTRGARRFSEYSLPFYLMGALDENVDGIEGTGCFEPDRDGSFRTGGRRIDPMVDLDQGKGGLNWIDREDGRVVLRDRNGTNIRYYRWEPEDVVEETEDLNVPHMLFAAFDDIESRSANYAIILAGNDGLFGDESAEVIQKTLGLANNPKQSSHDLAQLASGDNIVGVGQ